MKPEPGKTKISIRLDNKVIEFEHIHRRSSLDAIRQVVREELAPYGDPRGSNFRRQRTRSARR